MSPIKEGSSPENQNLSDISRKKQHIMPLSLPGQKINKFSRLQNTDGKTEQGATTTGNTIQNKQSLNKKLLFAIIASAFGSAFQHGYNTGVVNAPQDLIETWITNVLKNRSGGSVQDPDTLKSKVTLIWSIAVAIFCFGGMIGGLSTGFVADKFGRKGGLLLSNVLVLFSSALQGISKMYGSYELIIVGRFIIGINSGLNAGLAPMYLTEISPTNLRGSVGTVYQLVITLSILISQVLGLNYILGTTESWPILLAVIIFPCIFMFITLPFCPESPKHILINKKKDVEAERALQWFRGTNEVNDEMDKMREENEAMKALPRVTIREMLSNPMLRIPLGISVMLMVGQQLSGINAVIFYSTKIFKMAGMDNLNATYATLGMGTLNVIMTLISLIMVELAGRKTLLLVGFTTMFFDVILLTVTLLLVSTYPWLSTFAIVFVMLFVVAFATGPGSIPWFMVSELFNSSSRPLATSIAVGVNWAANILVGFGFLPLESLLKSNVFVIFIVLLGVFVIYVLVKVPETKNKTLEEIQMMFRPQS